jgi:hypothetical protein
MSTRKKRHLIAGTIIGGLLLAATTQTGNSFALSDTSSSSTASTPTTTQQTPAIATASPTPTSSSGSTTPTAPTDSIASGSTAMQSANTTAGSTTASTTDPTSTTSTTTPSTSGPTTSPTNTDAANTTTAANTVNSNASTGDATVKHTTDGGNATSGNASTGTTLINNITSSSNLNNGTLQTFNYNIDGTQNGNVVINPNNIIMTSNSGAPTTPANCAPGTTTADNSAAINNLVNLLAQSGNAKVSDNGVGGNATSGNATTEANIINTIQALVSDQGAFLGVININGDLNGNIELPASVINSLLTPTSGGGTASNSSAVNNDNINNNVTLTAITGNAVITNNGTAGSATSGNASTILQDCNLINSNIVGGNLLLVFVNVMGHWYGALLSEPTGDTTATLGGGITQDTVSPSQQTTTTNNATITNDVNLTSISGNATVANNGVGGNAITGNATAIADITNILGSQINLSGWLGILVINVFGTWDGSLVVQPASIASAIVGGNANTHTPSATHHTAPIDLGNGSGYYIVNPPQSFDAGDFNLASDQVLGTNTTAANNSLGSNIRQTATTSTHSTQTAKHAIVDYILAGIGVAFAITGGASRFFASRRNSL